MEDQEESNLEDENNGTNAKRCSSIGITHGAILFSHHVSNDANVWTVAYRGELS